MAVSRVSKKGLTSIPARVRKALGIEEGDTLVWEIDMEHGLALVKVVKNPIRYLKGKYSDQRITYDNVEELADKLLMRELHARN